MTILIERRGILALKTHAACAVLLMLLPACQTAGPEAVAWCGTYAPSAEKCLRTAAEDHQACVGKKDEEDYLRCRAEAYHAHSPVDPSMGMRVQVRCKFEDGTVAVTALEGCKPPRGQPVP
ncbi:MAG: hypothetical protein K2Q10_04705 [Rhodospirillales bacterium]|nr:hypothetical protein [Rhodospirillales bacterium]